MAPSLAFENFLHLTTIAIFIGTAPENAKDISRHMKRKTHDPSSQIHGKECSTQQGRLNISAAATCTAEASFAGKYYCCYHSFYRKQNTDYDDRRSANNHRLARQISTNSNHAANRIRYPLANPLIIDGFPVKRINGHKAKGSCRLSTT